MPTRLFTVWSLLCALVSALMLNLLNWKILDGGKIVCHPINWCHCCGFNFMDVFFLERECKSQSRYADEGQSCCITFYLQFNYFSHSQTPNNQTQNQFSNKTHEQQKKKRMNHLNRLICLSCWTSATLFITV